ncbi:hypothetical protein CEXT_670861 [Caerostris extrusa]|uniref:Uncharacterized protein n=1 Tax=Caerostris extrusa TaxID=172846 RepID=A0AAV4MRM9_CAEEX|nr:hypothetical protein CEXT_670861 [Caerostris extrusa]
MPFYPNLGKVYRINTNTSSDNENVENKANDGEVCRKNPRCENPSKLSRNTEELKRIQDKQYQNKKIPAKKFVHKPCYCLRLCNHNVIFSQRKR